MNSAHIIGNITADPELRHTPSGKAVCDITVAVNTGHGDHEETAFLGVTVWGAQAEAVARYKLKGDPVAVSGRLSQDTWQDKDTGQNRRKTKIVAQHVQFLHRPAPNGPRLDTPRQDTPRQAPQQAPQDHTPDVIPF